MIRPLEELIDPYRQEALNDSALTDRLMSHYSSIFLDLLETERQRRGGFNSFDEEDDFKDTLTREFVQNLLENDAAYRQHVIDSTDTVDKLAYKRLAVGMGWNLAKLAGSIGIPYVGAGYMGDIAKVGLDLIDSPQMMYQTIDNVVVPLARAGLIWGVGNAFFHETPNDSKAVEKRWFKGFNRFASLYTGLDALGSAFGAVKNKIASNYAYKFSPALGKAVLAATGALVSTSERARQYPIMRSIAGVFNNGTLKAVGKTLGVGVGIGIGTKVAAMALTDPYIADLADSTTLARIAGGAGAYWWAGKEQTASWLRNTLKIGAIAYIAGQVGDIKPVKDLAKGVQKYALEIDNPDLKKMAFDFAPYATSLGVMGGAYGLARLIKSKIGSGIQNSGDILDKFIDYGKDILLPAAATAGVGFGAYYGADMAGFAPDSAHMAGYFSGAVTSWYASRWADNKLVRGIHKLVAAGLAGFGMQHTPALNGLIEKSDIYINARAEPGYVRQALQIGSRAVYGGLAAIGVNAIMNNIGKEDDAQQGTAQGSSQTT